MKSRLNVGLSALFLAVAMVFAFQNCGQNGAISSSKATNDILSSDPVTPVGDPTNPKPPVKDPGKRPTTTTEDDDDSCEVYHNKSSCGNIKISEVHLSIDYISLPGGMIVLDADKVDFVISDSKKSIKLKALADADLSDIRIVLNEDGNFIASLKDKFPLKTPSAQQSGLKVKLDEPKSVKKDMMYELVVDLDLSKQVVQNKNKCLFKPVIHSAKLL